MPRSRRSVFFFILVSFPFSLGYQAFSAQADSDLRSRVEQAAGILKGLDQRSKLAKQAVPQAGGILDNFSGFLTTKPAKHDGISGGLFWRLSAVHWQLGQIGKQPAKSASPFSTGGQPVDPAVAAHVQAVRMLALTHGIHDDILKFGKSADEGLGKASKTLWGRNEKDSALKLDAFRRESAAGLSKAAVLLEKGIKARAQAQKEYLDSLGKPGMGTGDDGIGWMDSKKRAPAAKAGASGKGQGAEGTGVSQPEPGGRGSQALSNREASSAFGSRRDDQGLGRGGEGGKPEVARAPLAKKPLEADFHDWECLNLKEVSDLWGTIGFDKAWEKCQLISEICSNADAILGGRKKCYERELAGPSGDYFGCMDRAGVCQKKGAQPPAKPPACQGVMVSGKCQACPAGQKPKAGGGCGPTCGGKLFDPAKTCCVGKSVVLLTKGKCQPKCGKNTYNPKAACCSAEGKLLANHIADAGGSCVPACGGKVYDKAKACCSVGKLVPGQLEITTDKCGPACGTKGHDPKATVCCGGKTFDKAKFCCDGGKPLESEIKDLGQCAVRYQKTSPIPNGCTFVPDNPAGGKSTSFKNACDLHDTCYGTCKPVGQQDAQYMGECDKNLLNRMQLVCAKAQKGKSDTQARIDACFQWTGNFHTFLQGSFYFAAQKRNCRCCK